MGSNPIALTTMMIRHFIRAADLGRVGWLR